MFVRVDAIRADRAAGEFRGLPPSARDQLQQELGDKVVMQSSDWNCGNVITSNAFHAWNVNTFSRGLISASAIPLAMKPSKIAG